MSPQAANFDGSIFLSQELQAIEFFPDKLSLNFAGVTLVIRGGYGLEFESTREQGNLADGVGPTHLPVLVGDTVCEMLHEQPSGDLVLGFKSGATMVVSGGTGTQHAYQVISGTSQAVFDAPILGKSDTWPR